MSTKRELYDDIAEFKIVGINSQKNVVQKIACNILFYIRFQTASACLWDLGKQCIFVSNKGRADFKLTPTSCNHSRLF